jgi:hypothetical protein
MGGNQRNHLKRDNLSAKYALCSVGYNDRTVIKISESKGKGTLPGDFKVLRTPKALAEKKTMVFLSEEGESALVTYFDGTNIEKPFGIGQDDDFLTIKARIKEQMTTMPLTLETPENENYPASDLVAAKRIQLSEQYAPSKSLITA